jgi:hypothetical protein
MGYLKNSSAIAAAIATINLVKIAAGSHQMTYKKMYQKLKVINDTIIGNSHTKNMTAMIDSDAIDFIVYFLCSSNWLPLRQFVEVSAYVYSVKICSHTI